jgi:hypothetical protein
LYGVTYSLPSAPEKMPLTSPPASPKLQSQTGFLGCETVESDSPIKRNPWVAKGLVDKRTMLIHQNEHFLLFAALTISA